MPACQEEIKHLACPLFCSEKSLTERDKPKLNNGRQELISLDSPRLKRMCGKLEVESSIRITPLFARF